MINTEDFVLPKPGEMWFVIRPGILLLCLEIVGVKWPHWNFLILVDAYDKDRAGPWLWSQAAIIHVIKSGLLTKLT